MHNIVYVASVALLGYAAEARADNKDFEATFDRCAEFVGIGEVPVENARSLVPSPYEIYVDNYAQLVVRVVACDEVSVDGGKPAPARVAHIGVRLSVPNSDADIDNYLLWFVTDSGKLHGKLQAAGVKNGNDQQLSVMFEPIGADDELRIDVSAPKFPAYPLLGSAETPGNPPQDFIASWYADGKAGTLLMRTTFKALRFGGADLTLTPAPDSELAELIGSSPTLEFTVLESYNEWESASMQATIQ